MGGSEVPSRLPKRSLEPLTPSIHGILRIGDGCLNHVDLCNIAVAGCPPGNVDVKYIAKENVLRIF